LCTREEKHSRISTKLNWQLTKPEQCWAVYNLPLRAILSKITKIRNAAGSVLQVISFCQARCLFCYLPFIQRLGIRFRINPFTRQGTPIVNDCLILGDVMHVISLLNCLYDPSRKSWATVFKYSFLWFQFCRCSEFDFFHCLPST